MTGLPDTVVASGATSVPNPVPVPVNVDLSSAIAAVAGAEAVTAANAAAAAASATAAAASAASVVPSTYLAKASNLSDLASIATARVNLNIDQATTIADASTAITAATETAAYTTLTAARTLTIPVASTMSVGQALYVLDESGNCSGTNTITLAAQGADKINGASTYVLGVAFGVVMLTKVSAGKFTASVLGGVGIAPISGGGTGATTAATARANLGIDQETTAADTSPTIAAATRTLRYTSLTAARAPVLPLAASVNAGAWLEIVDGSGACSATNTITVTRQSSDTLNGGTIFVLNAPYSAVTLESDGVSKWTTIGVSFLPGTAAGNLVQLNSLAKLPAVDGSSLTNINAVTTDYQSFTANGTWTKPAAAPSTAIVIVMIWGAGGGGGTGTGGGGGACLIANLRLSDLGATETVTVGSAGTGGGSPTAGGASSFGAHGTAYGGGPGGSSTNSGGGGGLLSAGANGSAGSPAGGTPGNPGTDSSFGGGGPSNNASGAGGNSAHGGGAGGSGSGSGGKSVHGGGGGTGAGTAGTSIFGGNGGTSGVAGFAPAGGGGTSAAGARGEVRIWTIW